MSFPEHGTSALRDIQATRDSQSPMLRARLFNHENHEKFLAPIGSEPATFHTVCRQAIANNCPTAAQSYVAADSELCRCIVFEQSSQIIQNEERTVGAALCL